MRRGLVIGKFMPVHNGHLALITFAANQCNELIVSMGYSPQDPIDHNIRAEWLHELLKDNPKIKVETIVDDFDNESLEWPERTAIWARVLQDRYATIHCVISSETYGEHLANHLGASSILFDRERIQIPISASKIRSNPIQYWDYIPKLVQPYFAIKVCFNGPESTGKSIMAQRMAKKYKTEFVPEVAREIITSNDFTIDDIIKIGHAQTNRIKEKLKTANRFLFCDTDLITTQIYSQQYLNEVPHVLYELEKEITFDQYFLFDIDVPWVNDGLRDLGERRIEMMATFKREIKKRNVNPTIVSGNWNDREAIITQQLVTYK